MPSPDITVVVCTHNRAESLRSALASLYDLETGSRFTYEVLVVDNASPDHTSEVIREAAAASQAPLRGVHEPTKGIIAARNRGVLDAAGRWIAFFDDDQLADRRWLLELFAAAEQHRVRSVGGEFICSCRPAVTESSRRSCARCSVNPAGRRRQLPIPARRAPARGTGSWSGVS